jgi:tetratricopeptide (TPR) repeat protein
MTVFLVACLNGWALAQEDNPLPPARPRAPTPRLQNELSPDPNEEIVTYLHRKSDKYFHDGDYEGALNCWKLISILDPHFIEAYEVSWWMLWSLSVSAEQDGNKAESQKYQQRAVEILERGVLYNPNVYEVHYEFGQFYMATKQYDKARPHLSRAAQFKEAPVPVKRNLAHACERSGDLSASVAVWQQILQENPTDAVAVTNLRRVQAKMASNK